VVVGLRVTPLEQGRLQEGGLVRFRLTLADAASGAPLRGLYPAAWLDRRVGPAPTPAAACRDRVETLLGGTLVSKAELDLNEYRVVTMDEGPTLSVVDPLFGFGGTQLLARVELRAPAADWALAADGARLFVSQPAAGAVAAIETSSWHVATHVPTGPGPSRLALQPDGAYLWVAIDGGVAALQPASLAERIRLATGRGPHDLAVSDDNRYVFVTNGGDGTVSVVDVRALAVEATLATAPRPVSVAWCAAARTAYVAHADGTIAAIDGERPAVAARLQGEPGLAQIRCAPGGRLALAVATRANLLQVIDAARHRIVQSGPVGAAPDQIAFSDTLAYVRHLDSDQVTMVPLGELGREGARIPLVDFPGGQSPPGKGLAAALAPAIVRAPGANAVLVANPADGAVYYYMEGMAAPMGSFSGYGRPRAVLVVDGSLREREPGVYETTARLRRPGDYDLAVFLDAPRTVTCLDLQVAPDPQREARRRERPLQVRALLAGETLQARPGEEARLILEATDGRTGAPRPGLADLEVMAMAAGGWHARSPARELGGGRYEVTLKVPAAGVYYLYAAAASAGLGAGAGPPLAYLVARR
jgi:YVTN family beta-propeller protein